MAYLIESGLRYCGVPQESPSRLARERTNVSDEIRAVGPPPLPVLPDPFSVRVARLSDAPLVAGWMQRPHLAATWEYDWSVPRWEQHLSAQLNGTYSLPLVGSIDGVAHTYFELYRAARDSIAEYYESDPHDVGLHVAIGDPGDVHRGLAAQVFPHLIGGVFEGDVLCQRIVFDPDHRNLAARRACEYFGCRYLGEHDMPRRRMALYLYDRGTSGLA